MNIEIYQNLMQMQTSIELRGNKGSVGKGKMINPTMHFRGKDIMDASLSI
jgi:hypothetical protein